MKAVDYTCVAGWWCRSKAADISGKAMGILVSLSEKSLKMPSAFSVKSGRARSGASLTRLPADTLLADGSAPS